MLPIDLLSLSIGKRGYGLAIEGLKIQKYKFYILHIIYKKNAPPVVLPKNVYRNSLLIKIYFCI